MVQVENKVARGSYSVVALVVLALVSLLVDKDRVVIMTVAIPVAIYVVFCLEMIHVDNVLNINCEQTGNYV